MNQELSTTEAKQMKPIIFSTPMVKAILAGRKSQTRRILKTTRENDAFYGYSNDPDVSWPADYGFGVLMGRKYYDNEAIKCPYGKVGDILYVRETWCWDYKDYPERTEKYYFYKADTPENYLASGERWYPSIHMPRAAARIFMKITDISVERLQDITEEDAKAEGVDVLKQGPVVTYRNYLNLTTVYANPVDSFRTLWTKINGLESWNENPWIWKISFQRIEKSTP